MFGVIGDLLSAVLDVYKLAVVAYCVISLIKIPSNKWISMLASVVEPALVPTRKLLNQYLPKNWQMIDWSPVALYLAITIVQWIL